MSGSRERRGCDAPASHSSSFLRGPEETANAIFAPLAPVPGPGFVRQEAPQAESVRIAAACAGTRTPYTPLALGLTRVRFGVPVS
jgi:hypothetical protein